MTTTEQTRMASSNARPLAVVTGASTGIGYHLAAQCATHGHDLLIAADEPRIEQAASDLRAHGGDVVAVEADLASHEGLAKLMDALGGRTPDLLLANAGRGLGKAFVDQDWHDIARVIHTNVTGTVFLLHHVAAAMKARGSGRILITGSIAGFMPGSYQAVYNGTKAFVDSFGIALREELAETGVTVTVLMPGATQTEFFERADMMDTKVGTDEKDDPADVAKAGFDAMMDGDADVVSGLKNKVQAAMAHVTPAPLLAKQHTKMAKPGTAKR